MTQVNQSQTSRSVPGTWAKTFTYYAAFIALGLTTSSLGPTLPGLAHSTSSDIGKISFLFVLRSLGYLLGSFNAGRLYDKRPGNPVIAFSLAIIAALLIFVPSRGLADEQYVGVLAPLSRDHLQARLC